MLLERLGRYQIIEVLGYGAMGVVYQARDPLLDRTVALKAVDLELSGEDSAAFERRFYREARSAGRLNHSNIVTIHDVGKSDSVAYIAMELLQGQSLRDILDSGVVLPPEKIVDISAQVADGLAFAHENGVIHRDIKPANVMVLDSGRVKITDFGIALLPMGSRTLAGTVFGSPKYMSPEQVVGDDVDGRADVFSLGAVLYELLTGFAPFFGGDLDAVLSRVVGEMPAAPSSRNKSIPPAFDYIVGKAMAKDPAERYATAQAMATDLRNFRDLQPPSAPSHGAGIPGHRVICLRKGEVRLPIEIAAAAPSENTATTRAGTGEGASFRSRHHLAFFGVWAALLVVTGGALVATQAAHRAQSAGLPATYSAGAELLAVRSLPAENPAVAVPSSKAPDARERAQPASRGAAPTSSESANSVARPTAVAGRPTARLAVAVTPWGEVYVDGRKRGISPPLKEIRLAPGKHDIEIRNTMFPRYVQTVNLEADAQIKVKHKFQ
jgi:serine/threonine-protein kinase